MSVTQDNSFYIYAFRWYLLFVALIYLYFRFEPDMLAFSGCYYGGGDKERYELAEIRKRWATLPVGFLSLKNYDFVLV